MTDVWENTRKLFEFVRGVHGGPLFGEGANHYYWAGAIDGVEAQVQGGEHAQWLVDFDLLKLHPQMVNHGMGYHERWLESGYGPDWGRYIPPQYKLDQYRAMELAFGHAGSARDSQGVINDMAFADGRLYVNSRTAGYLPPGDPDYKRHLNAEGKPVDFGTVITDGSLVIEVDSIGAEDGHEGLVIRPIPRTREFAVKLRLVELLAALGTTGASELEAERISAEGLRVTGFGTDGKAILDVPFELNAGILSFQHTSAEVAYYYLDVSEGGRTKESKP